MNIFIGFIGLIGFALFELLAQLRRAQHSGGSNLQLYQKVGYWVLMAIIAIILIFLVALFCANDLSGSILPIVFKEPSILEGIRGAIVGSAIYRLLKSRDKSLEGLFVEDTDIRRSQGGILALFRVWRHQ